MRVGSKLILVLDASESHYDLFLKWQHGDPVGSLCLTLDSAYFPSSLREGKIMLESQLVTNGSTLFHNP